jgi:hypothetical protein
MTTTLLDERLTDADRVAITLAIEMERQQNPKEIASMRATGRGRKSERSRSDAVRIATCNYGHGSARRTRRSSSTCLAIAGVIGRARSRY